MAATFVWDESNGAGQTITSGITNVNWKNIDDATTVYTSYPVTAGANSYEKWQAGHFTGSYNQILNGKFGHTAGVLGTGLTLKCQPTMTADGDRLTYATPATTTNASLSRDITAVDTIANGAVVYFGATSANASGKAASTTSNPAWTNYLTTQLQTTVAALPGDTAQVTLTLSYDES
jgi:hypothetical protein